MYSLSLILATARGGPRYNRVIPLRVIMSASVLPVNYGATLALYCSLHMTFIKEELNRMHGG